MFRVFIRNLRNPGTATTDHRVAHQCLVQFDRDLRDDANESIIKGIRAELQKITGVDGFLALVGMNSVLKMEMQTHQISQGSDVLGGGRSGGRIDQYHVAWFAYRNTR
jgi:hypothetical protein